MLACDSKRALELKEARFEVFTSLKVRKVPRTRGRHGLAIVRTKPKLN